MSAPRIRKDQHQLVENSGSSKLNNHILRSIGISNINVEYSPVLWLQRNYSPTCVGPQNRNCHLPNLWICALSHYQIQQISSAIVSSSRSSLRHGALLQIKQQQQLFEIFTQPNVSRVTLCRFNSVNAIGVTGVTLSTLWAHPGHNLEHTLKSTLESTIEGTIPSARKI